MAAIFVALAIAFTSAHVKLDAKPCQAKPTAVCSHPAFK